MTRLKLWRKDFKHHNPTKGYCGFNYYLYELGINNNLWPKIWMIMIYLTGNNLKECTAEVYDKRLEPIKQKKEHK